MAIYEGANDFYLANKPLFDDAIAAVDSYFEDSRVEVELIQTDDSPPIFVKGDLTAQDSPADTASVSTDPSESLEAFDNIANHEAVTGLARLHISALGLHLLTHTFPFAEHNRDPKVQAFLGKLVMPEMITWQLSWPKFLSSEEEATLTKTTFDIGRQYRQAMLRRAAVEDSVIKQTLHIVTVDEAILGVVTITQPAEEPIVDKCHELFPGQDHIFAPLIMGRFDTDKLLQAMLDVLWEPYANSPNQQIRDEVRSFLTKLREAGLQAKTTREFERTHNTPTPNLETVRRITNLLRLGN